MAAVYFHGTKAFSGLMISGYTFTATAYLDGMLIRGE